MTRSSPPQRPLKTSRTLTTLSFRYQFKFSPKERAMASSKRLQCFRSALRLKSSSLYEKKSADLEEKTKEIPLRERERNTIEARKTSSHPTSLPIEVPSRDPRIRSYNEVPCEISETRSYNEVPIEMSKTLYFSTTGTVQGR